ncbi:efflux RND transporter permease subunit [Patescibacteria group bacterium]|nr:efflux RND transporter permease subunit [Patescibacteria group bacterium]MBU1758891.1 efflux RND transporter permease subunit [Patescibacteria group bacterium]
MSQIIKRQKLSPEINAINRDNGKRSISIQADKLDAAALSDITTAIADVIDQHPLPIGLEYTSGGDIQQLDQSTQDMSSAMMIGLLLMLIVLIIQFNNIKYGLLIVLSVTFTFG